MPSLDTQQSRYQSHIDDGGYLRGVSSGFDRLDQVWHHDQGAIDVQLLMPSGTALCPVIIYLPGLGEGAGAGQVWRKAWVQAGYAVLSVQSQLVAQALQDVESRYPRSTEYLDDDDELHLKDLESESGGVSSYLFGQTKQRPSTTGRSSEMRYLGHQYFAPEALRTHVQQLQWVVSQLKQGQLSGALARLDLSRVVLAGYDLGAQTVAAVLGEQQEGLFSVALDVKPVAAVILSPSVNLAKGHINSRFQGINVPLLVVTGPDDNDPYAISSGTTRQLIWQYASPGNKYLLSVERAGHTLFSGKDWGGRTIMRQPDHAGFTDESSYMQGNHRRSVAADAYSGQMSGIFSKNRTDYQALAYKNVAIIASVSAAFMDLQVKNDDFARFWLSQKAEHWLKPLAELKSR